jgi:DNA-binding LytR/AlgR family response regulator
MLIQIDSIQIVGSHTDEEMAVGQIDMLKPDLLFLDIELKNRNGLEVFESLQHKPILCLVTSHLEFAIKAYEIEAIDYIVKPPIQERIERVIQKAHDLIDLKKEVNEVHIDQEEVFIKNGNYYEKIKLNNILYINSLGDFSEFIFEDGSKKVALVNLKNLESQLPAHLFLRISRTCMIHRGKVTKVNGNSVFINSEELYFGTSYTDVSKRLLENATVIKRKV